MADPTEVHAFYPNDRNGRMRMRSIVDERSEHIYELASEQRAPQRRKQPPRMGSHDHPKYQPLKHSMKHLDTRPRSPLSNEFKTDLYKLVSGYPNGMNFDDFNLHTRRLLGNHYLDEYESSEVLNLVPELIYCKYGKVYLVTLPNQDCAENQNDPGGMNLCSGGSEMIEFSDDEQSEYSSYTDFPSVSRPTSRCDNKETSPINNNKRGTLARQHLCNDLRRLLDEPNNANGIWLKKLADIYEMKYSYPLRPIEYGFSTVLEMVVKLPDVFHVKQYRTEGDKWLTDARKCSSSPENNAAEKGEIPPSLVQKLKYLLKREKQIYTEDFESAYKRMYQQSFRPEDYGFENIDSFFQHLENFCSEVIRFRRIVDRTVMKLNYEQKSEPSPSEIALPGFTYNPFPPKVCNGDFKLEADPIFDELKEGDTFQINLKETYTPDHFYITHISRVELLREMMEDLNDFYESHQEKYVVLPSLVTRDLLCACIYSETSEWHRAQVISVNSKTVKILLFDYGTLEDTEISQLRYLHEDFAEHPPLCMRAKLSGIQPNGGKKYSDAASNEFLQHCRLIDLEVEIVHKGATWLEVLLYTLVGEDRMLVHEHLISEGFVSPKREEPISSVHAPIELPQKKASNINTAIYSETGLSDDQTAAISSAKDLPKVGSKNTIEFFNEMVAESNFAPTQQDNVLDKNTGRTTEFQSPQKQAWGYVPRCEQPTVCCFPPPPPPYTPVEVRSHPNQIPLPANVHVPYHAPYGQFYCPSYPCYTVGNPPAPNYQYQNGLPLVSDFRFQIDTPPATSYFQFHAGTNLASNSPFQAGTHVSPNFLRSTFAPTFSAMPNACSHTPSPAPYKSCALPPSPMHLPPGINISLQGPYASDTSNPRVGVFNDSLDNLGSQRVCSTSTGTQRQETISPKVKQFLELAVEQEIQKKLQNAKISVQPTAVNGADVEELKAVRTQHKLESRLKQYLNLSASLNDGGRDPTNHRTNMERMPECSSAYISDSIPKTKNMTRDTAAYHEFLTSPASLSNVRISGTNMNTTLPSIWTPSNEGTNNDQYSSSKKNMPYDMGAPNTSSSTTSTVQNSVVSEIVLTEQSGCLSKKKDPETVTNLGLSLQSVGGFHHVRTSN